MVSRPTIVIDQYVKMLQELAGLKGDVIGFVNIAGKMELGIDQSIAQYRQALQLAGRKDRIIVPANVDQAYLQSADQGQVVQMRRLEGYDFNQKFDLAVCDGLVFVCRQVGSSIKVDRINDPTAYDAYNKLLTDLWLAADPHDTSSKDLNHTVSELRALLTPYNVSDAHTHQSSSTSQADIIKSLPQLWQNSHYTEQARIESEFIHSFFELRHSPTAISSGQNYINYSASAIIALVSNYLRSHHISVSLISPCFDNLPDLLKDGGNLPLPIDESLLHNPDNIYTNLVKHVSTASLFLVNPNNPTGFCLDEFGAKGFQELARYCRDYSKLLILDLCFMPFICRDPAFEHLDCYKILDAYNVNYITIEDTGKILPLLDTKAAILHVSDQLIPQFERLHTNYILRHSPFVLKVVTQFINDAISSNLAASYGLFDQNHNYLVQTIQSRKLPFKIQKRQANLSIAWLAITATNLAAHDIQAAARAKQVELLAGDKFFWDNPSQGSAYVRIALARDPQEFSSTIDQLATIVADLLN